MKRRRIVSVVFAIRINLRIFLTIPTTVFNNEYLELTNLIMKVNMISVSEIIFKGKEEI